MAFAVQQAGLSLWRLVHHMLLGNYFSPINFVLLGVFCLAVLATPVVVYLCFLRAPATTNVSIHMEQNQRSAQAQIADHCHDPAQPRRRSDTAVAIENATRVAEQRIFWQKVSIYAGLAGALSLLLASTIWWLPALHVNYESRPFPLGTLMNSATAPSQESDTVYGDLHHVKILTDHVKKLVPNYNAQNMRRLMVEQTGNQGLCWSDLVGTAMRETEAAALKLHEEASMLKKMSWWSWREVMERVTVIGESILFSACSGAAAIDQPQLCASHTKQVFRQGLSEVSRLEDKVIQARNTALGLLFQLESLQKEAFDVHHCYSQSTQALQDKVKQQAQLPWYWKVLRAVMLPAIERSQVERDYHLSNRRLKLETELGWANVQRLLTEELCAQSQRPVQVLQRFIVSLDQYLKLVQHNMSKLEGLANKSANERHLELSWEERRAVVLVSMKGMVRFMAPLAIDRRPVKTSSALVVAAKKV